MRYILIFPLLSSLLFASNVHTAANHAKSSMHQAAGVTRVYETAVANNRFTRNLDYLVCDVANDTLYFINNSKLVKLSLKSRTLTVDASVSLFLAQKHHLHRDATHISVVRNGYLINLGLELDFVSGKGTATVLYASKSAILDDIPQGNNIILATPSGVTLINMQGKKLDEIAFELGGIGFYHVSQGLGNADDPVHIAEFTHYNVNHIKKSFYPSTDAFKTVSNILDVAWSDDHNFFLYDDASRDKIFVVKKGEKKLFKTIPLGQSCDPTSEEAENEEGSDPNFKVIPGKIGYYIIALAKKKLVVLQFEI